MTNADKRCGTCRHYRPDTVSPGDGYCHAPMPDILPQWARAALGDATICVDVSDGTDCEAWEAKQ